MIALTSWLIIGLAIVALWALWGMLNLIADLLEKWYAAHRREDSQSNKEKGSFSL